MHVPSEASKHHPSSFDQLGGRLDRRVSPIIRMPRRLKSCRWGRAAREPLVHFLAIGLVLFSAYSVFNPAVGELSRHDITVDRQALVRFVQFRTRSFDEQQAQAILAALPAAEQSRLIDDFVREEVMHREAVAWGLDIDDYVIRRRLVQSLEFATRNASVPSSPLTAHELRRYYHGHKQLYSAPPAISFTHIYFNAGIHGWTEALRLARVALPQLNGSGGTSNGQVSQGDRFLYFLNYAGQGPDLVRSHFGEAMADTLFRLSADPNRWQGPFKSAHGVHLVRVTEKSGGGVLPYAEVKPQVERDATEDRTRLRQQAVLDKLVAQYRVHLADDIRDIDVRAD